MLKRQQNNGSNNSSNDCELRLLIHNNWAVAITAKSKKELSEKYNALFDAPDESTPERVLSIVCSLANMERCVAEVLAKMKLQDVRVLIHRSHAEALVANGNKKLGELRIVTRCDIEIASKCCPTSNEHVCRISGSSTNLAGAIQRLLEFMLPIKLKYLWQKYNTKCHNPNVAYGGFEGLKPMPPFVGQELQKAQAIQNKKPTIPSTEQVRHQQQQRRIPPDPVEALQQHHNNTVSPPAAPRVQSVPSTVAIAGFCPTVPPPPPPSLLPPPILTPIQPIVPKPRMSSHFHQQFFPAPAVPSPPAPLPAQTPVSMDVDCCDEPTSTTVEESIIGNGAELESTRMAQVEQDSLVLVELRANLLKEKAEREALEKKSREQEAQIQTMKKDKLILDINLKLVTKHLRMERESKTGFGVGECFAMAKEERQSVQKVMDAVMQESRDFAKINALNVQLETLRKQNEALELDNQQMHLELDGMKRERTIRREKLRSCAANTSNSKADRKM